MHNEDVRAVLEAVEDKFYPESATGGNNDDQMAQLAEVCAYIASLQETQYLLQVF